MRLWGHDDVIFKENYVIRETYISDIEMSFHSFKFFSLRLQLRGGEGVKKGVKRGHRLILTRDPFTNKSVTGTHGATCVANMSSSPNFLTPDLPPSLPLPLSLSLSPDINSHKH